MASLLFIYLRGYVQVLGGAGADNGSWTSTGVMLTAVCLGIVIGHIFNVSCMDVLVRPFLMAMLFLVFMAVDVHVIGESFRNVRFSLSAIVLNFVWTPILGLLIGELFFHGSLDLRIGLMMLLVTPCTDWYLVFTALSKGNVALSSAILPVNLVLQVVLLPIYLFVFFGEGTGAGFGELVFESFLIISVPLLLAWAIRSLGHRGTVPEAFLDRFENTDNAQLVLLCLAIFVIFSTGSAVLVENAGLLVSLVLPLLVFFTVNYFVSVAVSKLNGFGFADTTSLVFTTLARNSPLALAMVSSVFADRPLVLMALAIGPLVELPVLSVVASHRLEVAGIK